MNKASVEERFWDKVDKRGPNECWEWTASTFNNGYGRLRWHGKSIGAHRVSYSLFVGAIGSLFVCHHCDNKICVNPAHLFLGTAGDNARDRDRKGRTANRKGTAHPLSRLTEDQVHEIRTRVRGETLASVAQDYNVSPSNIRRIKERETWVHI